MFVALIRSVRYTEQIAQLVERQTHAPFDSSQRDADTLGDFGMRESTVVCQINHLSLLGGQGRHRQPYSLVFQTLYYFRPCILFGRKRQRIINNRVCARFRPHTAHLINCAVMDNCQQPGANRPTTRVIRRTLPPYIEKRFLNNILRAPPLPKEAIRECEGYPTIAVIKQFNPTRVTFRNLTENRGVYVLIRIIVRHHCSLPHRTENPRARITYTIIQPCQRKRTRQLLYRIDTTRLRECAMRDFIERSNKLGIILAEVLWGFPFWCVDSSWKGAGVRGCPVRD